MSKQYELKFDESGHVKMPFNEFVSLCGELEAAGIHVAVVSIEINKAIVFTVEQRTVMGGKK